MSMHWQLQGFRALTPGQRLARLAQALGRPAPHGAVGALSVDTADRMVENVIGTFGLPLALGLNFRINDKDYMVPTAIEEPSVVAAMSSAAKAVRAHGGFRASAEPSLMIGQLYLSGAADMARAGAAILAARAELLQLADSFHPALVARGGGAREIEVRVLGGAPALGQPDRLAVHVLIDTCDAMGANLVNTVVEGLAPRVQALAGAAVRLRILSNLADRRLARAECALPVAALATAEFDGPAVAHGIVEASQIASVDPYRAATHNKGIMNGIDGVAIATGQDWRALEAGAHAYAAAGGHYRALSSWRCADGVLHGSLCMPMAVGTVGGPIRIHPGVQFALGLLGVGSARELAAVLAAVGLAQNFAALRALGSTGIQRGHMALHARSVALAAGAGAAELDAVAAQLASCGDIKEARARLILARMAEQAGAAHPLPA